MFDWLIRKKNKRKKWWQVPEYTLGRAKSLDDLRFDDFKEYPVWVYALDDETEEGIDESYVKPITNSDDADGFFLEAYILLKDEMEGIFLFGRVEIEDMYIDDLWYEDPQTGKPVELLGSEYENRIFVAVAKIDGMAGCRFRLDKERKVLVSLSI